MPPMSPPNTTMITGSISDESDATASSTSASKKSATLDSMPSSAPDSSPIDTIWITMLGKRLEFCIATVRAVPVLTSCWMILVAAW